MLSLLVCCYLCSVIRRRHLDESCEKEGVCVRCWGAMPCTWALLGLHDACALLCFVSLLMRHLTGLASTSKSCHGETRPSDLCTELNLNESVSVLCFYCWCFCCCMQQTSNTYVLCSLWCCSEPNCCVCVNAGNRQLGRPGHSQRQELIASAQQSQIQANRYKQIRNDYNRLLYK